MRPTTAITGNVFDFDYLLHPGTRFEHPQDVVYHPGLSIGEKRAILSSWASDASAIASCPSLRAPVGLKAPVTIDEILEALCAHRDIPGDVPPCERVIVGLLEHGAGGVSDIQDPVSAHSESSLSSMPASRDARLVGDSARPFAGARSGRACAQSTAFSASTFTERKGNRKSCTTL